MELRGELTNELGRDRAMPSMSIQIISGGGPDQLPRISFASQDAIEPAEDCIEEIGILQLDVKASFLRAHCRISLFCSHVRVRHERAGAAAVMVIGIFFAHSSHHDRNSGDSVMYGVPNRCKLHLCCLWDNLPKISYLSAVSRTVPNHAKVPLIALLMRWSRVRAPPGSPQLNVL
jgi:hypothetical protein